MSDSDELSEHSDKHSDRSSRPEAGASSGGARPPVDPQVYERAELREALAGHDIPTLYRALTAEGMTQRQIAQRTGQAQSEVSEILKGRKVIAYDVLARIADGLVIPREYMGLSFGEQSAYPGGGTTTTEQELLAMLRRHVLAYGGAAISGAAVAVLGQVLARLPGPPAVPLPARLSRVHVTKVHTLTRRLGEAGTGSVSAPEVLSVAAAWASGLLDVPGDDAVQRALKVAVAELHVEAGWAAFSDLLHPRALYHYAQALELATDAQDAYLQAIALHYSGLVSAEHGALDEGLKMLQCAQVAAWNIPKNEERAVVVGEVGRDAVEATTAASVALVLAQLGNDDKAERWLTKGRQLWTPRRTEPFGDMDRPGAQIALLSGRLDLAEQFATASLRRWEDGGPISRALSGIVLATVHVRAGERDGLVLAHDAIVGVRQLSSARPRARRRLVPLAEALEAYPHGDASDLARQARQLAA